MPGHWTYDPNVGVDDDLEQGDYLAPTDALRAVLEEVHPHFCNDKYVGFVIATQSCDVVRRRGGECVARYISIAAVRTLYGVLPRLAASVDGAVVRENVFLEGRKPRVRELLARIVDQNEQQLGLFYFHEDADRGIGDPCVAYLRVTVALKADHYTVLREARRARLKPEFQAKFGWLLGNLYARPATTDWADQDRQGGREVIDRLLKSESLRWVDDKQLELLKSKNPDLPNLSADELLARAKEEKPKRAIEEVADIAGDLANKRMTAILTARLQTFAYHAKKLLAPAPVGEPAPNADALAPDDVATKVVALAREHICNQMSVRNSTSSRRPSRARGD